MPHLSLRVVERNAPTKDLRPELLDFQCKDAISRWRVETVKGELTALNRMSGVIAGIDPKLLHAGLVMEVGFPECMVRRRVASGKMSLAVGLRQCIRPLVESMTPGLDGHPLAFAPINWTVW
jgi:hypothetical protein